MGGLQPSSSGAEGKGSRGPFCVDLSDKNQLLPIPCRGFRVQRGRGIISRLHLFGGTEETNPGGVCVAPGIVQLWRGCSGVIKWLHQDQEVFSQQELKILRGLSKKSPCQTRGVLGLSQRAWCVC